MKLRARWAGPVPRVGDYLMSPTRPRYAYRVRGVMPADSNVRWDAGQKAEVRRLAIDVDRVDRGQVTSTARVHTWRWDKRSARTAT